MSVLVLVLLPAQVRLYTVSGNSDAPALVSGDHVLVHLSAYDLHLPYTNRVLVSVGDPKPGDLVLIRSAEGVSWIKRVVAGPGTRIGLSGNHLRIDGRELQYEELPGPEEGAIRWGGLGSVVEREAGNGPAVVVSFTPGDSGGANMEEVVVPEASYFVLGSNRDHSLDSRTFGAVPRDRIAGKVVWGVRE